MELKSEEGCRDRFTDGLRGLERFRILSAHSFTVVTSPPSSVMSRGSAGLPRRVP